MVTTDEDMNAGPLAVDEKVTPFWRKSAYLQKGESFFSVSRIAQMSAYASQYHFFSVQPFVDAGSISSAC
jgi:hypothetical protein